MTRSPEHLTNTQRREFDTSHTSTTIDARTGATLIHKFEQAGLGKAPFTAEGCAERVFVAAPGEPAKAGGTCAYCSQGIRWAVIVRSADGRTFDVGLDCAESVGGKGMRRVAADGKRQQNRARRELQVAREADRILWAKLMIRTPEIVAVAGTTPHPSEWRAAQGDTVLDGWLWMLGESVVGRDDYSGGGHSGRIKVTRAIEKLAKQLLEE